MSRSPAGSCSTLPRCGWRTTPGLRSIVPALLSCFRAISGRAGQSDLREFAWHWLWGQCHAEVRTLVGHTDEVFSVAFSPDGTPLATASKDGTARIWDVPDRQDAARPRRVIPTKSFAWRSRPMERCSPPVARTSGSSCGIRGPASRCLRSTGTRTMSWRWPFRPTVGNWPAAAETIACGCGISQHGRRCVCSMSHSRRYAASLLTGWSSPGRLRRSGRHSLVGHGRLEATSAGLGADGPLFAIDFCSDSQHLIAAGRDARLYYWNLAKRTYVRFYGT